MSSEASSPGPSLASRMQLLQRAVADAVYERLAQEGYAEVRPPHVRLMDQMGAGCRMTDLAHRLQMTKPAVTQLANHLERLGLVERIPDPSDGRSVILRPTAASSRGYLLGRQVVDRVEEQWRNRLGDIKFEAFRAALEELAGGVEDQGTAH